MHMDPRRRQAVLETFGCIVDDYPGLTGFASEPWSLHCSDHDEVDPVAEEVGRSLREGKIASQQ